VTQPPAATLNRLKGALTRRQPAFGVIATIPSVQSMQVLANAGLDWVLIDLEHAPIDLAAAHAMIVATAGTAAVPWVRVPSVSSTLVKPAMDFGALGICFPMIATRQQAEAAARVIRYPPAGERLWGPFYAPLRWGRSMAEYIQSANDAMQAIITIESGEAVRNIDEIVSVPGIDLAFIGTGDLAMSLGVPGQLDHPELKAVVAAAEAGILRSSVALGGVARTPDQAKQLLDRGYSAIVLGFDWLLLQRAAVSFLEAVK